MPPLSNARRKSENRSYELRRDSPVGSKFNDHCVEWGGRPLVPLEPEGKGLRLIHANYGARAPTLLLLPKRSMLSTRVGWNSAQRRAQSPSCEGGHSNRKRGGGYIIVGLGEESPNLISEPWHNLPEIIYPILAPLYERFGFFQITVRLTFRGNCQDEEADVTLSGSLIGICALHDAAALLVAPSIGGSGNTLGISSSFNLRKLASEVGWIPYR